VFTFLAASGCATYTLPTSRLESPEASGPDRVGRVEVGSQSGVDLVTAAAEVVPPAAADGTQPASTFVLSSSLINPWGSFTRALGESLDVSVKIQPASPLMIKAKYQLSGAPESKADKGNFPIAATAGGGLLMGVPSSGSVMGFGFDVGLLAGYRLGTRHLVMLSPYLSFLSLSGLAATAGASSGSAMIYGGALGYQYTLYSLFLKLEASYTLGGSGTNSASPLGFGAALGVNL